MRRSPPRTGAAAAAGAAPFPLGARAAAAGGAPLVPAAGGGAAAAAAAALPGPGQLVDPDAPPAIVVIGTLGVGKSQFCRKLTGDEDPRHFKVSNGDVLSVRAEAFPAEVPGLGPCLVVDTAGFDENSRVDAEHLHQMVQRVSEIPNIKGFVFCIKYDDDRHFHRDSLQQTVRIFSYVFKEHFWSNLTFLCTKTLFDYERVDEEAMLRKTRHINHVLKEKFPVAPVDGGVEVLFVDSAPKDPEGPLTARHNAEQLQRLTMKLRNQTGFHAVVRTDAMADMEIVKAMRGDPAYTQRQGDWTKMKEALYNAGPKYANLVASAPGTSMFFKEVAARKLNYTFMCNPGDGARNNWEYTHSVYAQVMNDVLNHHGLKGTEAETAVYTHDGSNPLRAIKLGCQVANLLLKMTL